MFQWNDIELVDGRFYIVEITPWNDGHKNRWIYSFRANLHEYFTQGYVSAYFGSSGISEISRSHAYTSGRVCSNDDVISLREATYDEIREFLKALSSIGYEYNLNTRKVYDTRVW
jgi:hypothetical protein